MPEIPEIASRALELNQAIIHKTIKSVEVQQPKSLNLPLDDFAKAMGGATVISVLHHGKWIQVKLSSGWLLLNMGMGGEILLTSRDKMPEKYRVVFDFTDGTCLTINFWWFGYVHFAPADGISLHPMVGKLGPNILDISKPEFVALLRKQKGRVKQVLLDQSKFAGIGNAYIHDILFLAKLHPNIPVTSLSEKQMCGLFEGIQDGLIPSLKKGGAFYEKNIFGQKGGFAMEDILIGYRENTPCPECGTRIIKIKTGSTSSFICPQCQPEPK